LVADNFENHHSSPQRTNPRSKKKEESSHTYKSSKKVDCRYTSKGLHGTWVKMENSVIPQIARSTEKAGISMSVPSLAATVSPFEENDNESETPTPKNRGSSRKWSNEEDLVLHLSVCVLLSD
jgi:hypothetical protein